MKQRAILVTGGAGFIGSEFVRQASVSDKYSKIFVVDSLTYASDLNRIRKEIERNQIELLKADVQDTHQYLTALKESAFIIHFAAETHVDNSITNGKPFLSTNVLGTYNLLEAARLHSISKILIVSTDEVYGSTEHGSFLENDSLNPSSTYSASKSAADLLALAQFKTFQQSIIIARSVNNYGPFQHSEKFIPNAIYKILAGKKISLYGDGQNVREWIHVSDHVSALNTLLESGVPGEIYNIGSGELYSNLEIAVRLLNLLDSSPGCIEYVTDRKGHDYRYALNSSKVRDKFGWSPKINFETGITKLVEFSKSEFLREKIKN